MYYFKQYNCSFTNAVVEVNVNWLVNYCLQSNVGAKNHAVIMPDASMDATLNTLVAAGFGAAGQKCMALSTVVFVGGLNPWYCHLSPSYLVIFSFVLYLLKVTFHVCLCPLKFICGTGKVICFQLTHHMLVKICLYAELWLVRVAYTLPILDICGHEECMVMCLMGLCSRAQFSELNVPLSLR